MHEGDKTELVGEAADEQASVTKLSEPRDNGDMADRCCPPRGVTLIILLSLIFSTVVTIALVLTILFGEGQVTRIGSVASDSTAVGKCGLQMLQLGGSAVDAAVAAALCSAVVQYHVTGLGGGGLMLVHNHRTDVTKLFDFREAAPQSLDAKQFASATRDRIMYSGLGVGVPGFALGLARVHQQFGRLRWAQLFHPALELAGQGYLIDSQLHRSIAANAALIRGNPTLSKLFLAQNGSVLPVGRRIKRPDLAGVLAKLRDSGAAVMYSGELGQQILAAVNARAGSMRLTDLTGYRVLTPEAITGHYYNFTIRTFPAPTAGGPFLLLVANIMSGFNATSASDKSPLYYHRLAEAMKFAHAVTATLGEGEVARQATVIGPEFANAVRNSIPSDRVYSNSTNEYAKFAPAGVNGTAQLSAVDNNELYVSMATSINSPFGSFITTDSGILLNNQLAEFSAAHASTEAAAGRRPVTLMSPAFVFNPRQRCGLRFAIGASNNTRMPAAVISAVTQLAQLARSTKQCPKLLSAKVDERQPCLPVPHAIGAPRIAAQFDASGPFVEYEASSEFSLPSGIVAKLRSLGQRMLPAGSDGIGFAQVVAMDMYSLLGYSDTYRAGAVAQSLSNK